MTDRERVTVVGRGVVSEICIYVTLVLVLLMMFGVSFAG